MGLAKGAADKVVAVTFGDGPGPRLQGQPGDEYFATLKEYGAKDVDPMNGIVAYGYTQEAVFLRPRDVEGDDLARCWTRSATSSTTDLGVIVRA